MARMKNISVVVWISVGKKPDLDTDYVFFSTDGIKWSPEINLFDMLRLLELHVFMFFSFPWVLWFSPTSKQMSIDGLTI